MEPSSPSLLAMESCALRAPATVGENCTVKVVVPPPEATGVLGVAVTAKFVARHRSERRHHP